jgi:hypothetical protein
MQFKEFPATQEYRAIYRNAEISITARQHPELWYIRSLQSSSGPANWKPKSPPWQALFHAIYSGEKTPADILLHVAQMSFNYVNDSDFDRLEWELVFVYASKIIISADCTFLSN